MKSFYTGTKRLFCKRFWLTPIFCSLFISVSFANTYTVANTDDAGAGSLRQAIADALAAEVGPHVIDASKITGTINLQSALPLITKVTLTINGPSPNKGSLALSRAGAAYFRFFTIDNSGGAATLTLNRVSLTNGYSTDNGGAISINNANVNLNYCTISNCFTASEGGGIYIIGSNSPVLNMESCSLISNTAGTSNISGRGGAISSLVQGTTGSPKAYINASNCTFANNTAAVGSGGINLTYTIGTFKNCTISGNTAQSSSGGGLTVGSSGEATLINCTVTKNKSLTSVGGGIRSVAAGLLTLVNTLVVGNFANGTTPDDTNWGTSGITGKTASYSVIGVHTGQAYNSATQSTIGSSATPAVVNLGALSYNGGPTQTHRLLSSTPEIAKDKGSAASLSGDQRGAARLIDDPAIANASGGDGSDIGAFEVNNYTWLGTVSTSFDNSTNGNWTDGAAPAAGANVFLPEGSVQNEPVINNNLSLNNLVLGTGRTLTISSGKTLTVNGSFTHNGIIKGTGTLAATNLVNNGIVAPGNSPGLLSINGNYNNGSGTLAIELGGAATAGTSYDQLAVSGAATLSGTLDVSLVNGFTPAAGNQFTVMTYGSGTGSFGAVSLPNIAPLYWNVLYNATGLVLKVTSFPLPVNLLGFSGKKTTLGNELSWTTTGESSVKEYVVEWSADANNWRSVYVIAARNTPGENKYSFLHRQAAEESYYRLKAIDEDGKLKLSQVVKIGSAATKVVTAYPNPAYDHVTLTLPTAEKASIQWINAGGQVVLQNTANTSLVNVDIRSLKAGMYQVRIEQAGKISVISVLKQ